MPYTFSESIRAAIKAGPLRQSELADRLGVTRATISGLVRGEHFAGEALLNGIARELGLKVVVARRPRGPKGK